MFCSIAGAHCRLLCYVLTIRIQLLYCADCQLAQCHRLILSLQSDDIHAFLKVEYIGLSDITSVISEVSLLPVIYFHLCRTDLVALIVNFGLAAIGPDSGERNISCILKRNLTIDVNHSLGSYAS